VLAVAQEAGWTLPPAVESRATAGLAKFVKGTITRTGALPSADLTIRKLAAIDALARHGAADPSLFDSIAVEPTLWPTSAVIDWWSALRRMPAVRDRDARVRLAEQVLRARLDVRGTVTTFSTDRSDALWWLMVSPDTNAARLVLGLLEAGQWADELPRIVRGALGRQRRGAWDTTVANAWGALAVEKFSRARETAPVAGAAVATLGGDAKRLDWARTPGGGALAFPWPAGRGELVVEQDGPGRPWATVEARAAVPARAPVTSGYRVTKTLVPIETRRPASSGRWSEGDLVRVRLEIEAQSDMTWVVVDDPIPAGASHLGTGLARQSSLAAEGGEAPRGPWPAFEERPFDAFRAYYDYVPRGRFVAEYVVRLNGSGVFETPATRVEALYAPDVFGELPNAPLRIEP